MARKIGYGRSSKDPTERSRAGLAKRLIPLALIEAVGIAILIRGILTDNIHAMIAGGGWVLILSLVTLLTVLKFAGLKRPDADKGPTGTWRDADDEAP